MSLRRGLAQAQSDAQRRLQPNLVMNSYPGLTAGADQSVPQFPVRAFLSAVRAGEVDIQVRASGKDNVEILFSDNGCGMSLDVRRRAFDPFFTDAARSGSPAFGCTSSIPS